MPTYTYQCHNCAYLFEKEQKITDPPLTTCPKCGGPVKRVITGGLGFILKGSGFYATDYKRKSTPQKAEKKKEECCGQTNPCSNPKRCCQKH
ncbi:FmdB family transcriptional regulator [Candidatus Desulfofervidus auxilii]|uniref:FmdB family transcriptional regulator n=1 Tax=Desulfofervidus auxilii TaxID=1621989 RepID=A0A7U4TGX4_DESA2|nr:FmdB family zinc ribbon protein [Candidatus Desulfofervidus auxilii]AMM41234.1 FmdB family transcriptional regulator [Candidatus Desulfofervidus auxilii]